MKKQNFTHSFRLREKAHAIIPGGCHTYSKGDDQFPFLAPGFIQSGMGCRVKDIDGNEFLDWGMGLRSVSLGYSYPRVNRAVIETLLKGTNFTRPALIEQEVAELILQCIPTAEMIKFSKNGSDVTTAAIRISRAYTGRKRIAICQDHPFFSIHDWFIGTTPCNNGIPEEIRNLTLTFKYNDIKSVEVLFEQYPNDIAALILEPVTYEKPKNQFLEKIRELTKKHGTILIFDEMITGLRFGFPGAQTLFQIEPDLSTFGKAIGNGFSCSFLTGKKDILKLGGIHHSEPRVFLLSSTHGAETHCLAAVRETFLEFQEKDIIRHIAKIGSELMSKWKQVVKTHQLEDYLQIIGYPCSPVIQCKDQNKHISNAFRTLFLQEMIRNGILIPYISISFSHGTKEVDETIAALEQVCKVYKKALEENIDHYLIGSPVKPVFRRYN